MVVDAKHVTVEYIMGDLKDTGLKRCDHQKIKGTYSVRKFEAVQDVTFALGEGDMCGIIGSNGVGKSTLLKVITGLCAARRRGQSIRKEYCGFAGVGIGALIWT